MRAFIEGKEISVYETISDICNKVDVGNRIVFPMRKFGVFTATAQRVEHGCITFMFDKCISKRSMNCEIPAPNGFLQSELNDWMNFILLGAFPGEFRDHVRNLTLPTCGQIFGHHAWYDQAIEPDDEEQFILMKVRRNRISGIGCEDAGYWLKNPVKQRCLVRKYAAVGYDGYIDFPDETRLNGVRPVFQIVV